MNIQQAASVFIIVINVFTIVFFFGFHFGAFKTLVNDVTAIRVSSRATEKKVGETAEKVAYIEGTLNGRRSTHDNR